MNIFLISDTHFQHQAPYTKFTREDGTMLRPHGSAEAGDEAMIENWNKVVSPNSKVYHLGDVFMTTKANEIVNVMRRLNGTKVLIKGNHDVAKLSVYAEYFKDVRAYHVLANLALSQVTNMPPRGQGQAVDPVQQVAGKTGAPIGVVRTFTKISAPENAHLFTAEAAHKAFALEEVIQHFKS